MRAFYDRAERRPWPASAPSLVFNEHVLILETYFEPVFERSSLAINDIGKQVPKGDH